jgi:hypothetical protein
MVKCVHFEDFHTGDFIPVEIVPVEEFDKQVLVAGSEVNVIAGNCDWKIAGNLFSPVSGNDLFLQIPRDMNWAQLLFALGVFPSKTQALKNWLALGRELSIRDGFETVHLGKARRIEVHIWKPVNPPQQAAPA